MKVLITSGGMEVPIDAVRSITNFSSGRFGCELARAFSEAGHQVIFFAQRNSRMPEANFRDIKIVPYQTYEDYRKVKDLVLQEQPNLILSAAAVADYTVDPTPGKISSAGEVTLTLKPADKILPDLRSLAPTAKIVGFKLLVSPRYEEAHAAVRKQMADGRVDHVVYNDLTELRKGNQTRLIFSRVRPSPADIRFDIFKNAAELVELLAVYDPKPYDTKS